MPISDHLSFTYNGGYRSLRYFSAPSFFQSKLWRYYLALLALSLVFTGAILWVTWTWIPALAIAWVGIMWLAQIVLIRRAALEHHRIHALLGSELEQQDPRLAELAKSATAATQAGLFLALQTLIAGLLAMSWALTVH